MARPKKEKQKSEKPEISQWLRLFLDFIANLSIDSKETGVGPLNLYGSQKRFLAELIDGLDRDIHTFVFLKARQLGISTVSLAVDLFWLIVHPGMQGCLVTDTEGNRDKFRIIIGRFLKSLPPSYQIDVPVHNRNGLVMGNGSSLDYIVAGTRKTATDTGKSRAYNFLHATEVSNYGSIKGITSLFATLAEKHQDRLYIFESTANGYNLFFEMWNNAKADSLTQKAAFIGWWANEQYCLEEGTELFDKYWDDQVDSVEQEKINRVWEKYGVRILPGQLAWYRYKEETSTSADGSMDENYPWDEDDAFLQTGHTFFPVKKMALTVRTLASNPPPFLGYAYEYGGNFMDTKINTVRDADDAELKIYEMPSELGKYVIGVDPAQGDSDNADNSVIEVFRCYSDRLVQVAEFASSEPINHQVAWVVAHLAGLYKDVMMIIELNGPGEATTLELNHLRQLFDAGALPTPGDGSIKDIFGSARWFMYHRSDSPGAGFVFNWKCLALETPLPTPTGWTTMANVGVGDYLLDDKGRPCCVTGISPVHLHHKCYRIEFDDGTEIVADEDHLWPTHVHQTNWRDGQIRLTKTKDLVAGKHVMPINASLELEPVDLPVHPYTLGVWLGDGKSAAGAYFAGRKDFKEINANLANCGETFWKETERPNITEQTVIGLHVKLRELGLLHNKHIPKQYLRASREQRLALLQGLMDTDGDASSKSGRQCGFTTSKPKLAEGFSELLRGLGFKAKRIVRHRKLMHNGTLRDCAPAYQYWFRAVPNVPLFRLPRKQANIDNFVGEEKRIWHRIRKMEEVDSVPVKCVTVDSESHLFLAGEAMVPTHNSNSDNKTTIMTQLKDSIVLEAIEVRSIKCAMEIQSLVQDGVVFEPALSTGKDDRVCATAYAHRAWTDWVRGGMIAMNDTWDKVTKMELASQKGDHDTMVSHIVSSFFQGKVQDREDAEIQAQWDE